MFALPRSRREVPSGGASFRGPSGCSAASVRACARSCVGFPGRWSVASLRVGSIPTPYGSRRRCCSLSFVVRAPPASGADPRVRPPSLGPRCSDRTLARTTEGPAVRHREESLPVMVAVWHAIARAGACARSPRSTRRRPLLRNHRVTASGCRPTGRCTEHRSSPSFVLAGVVRHKDAHSQLARASPAHPRDARLGHRRSLARRSVAAPEGCCGVPCVKAMRPCVRSQSAERSIVHHAPRYTRSDPVS